MSKQFDVDADRLEKVAASADGCMQAAVRT
jgi:hypothetical protein